MSIASAIQSRNLLSFVYDGFRRTVEPHTFGVDAKGHAALRAYQVAGGSESGEYVGWKLFHAWQCNPRHFPVLVRATSEATKHSPASGRNSEPIGILAICG